ncbi:hypothetical protein FJZ21_00535 [Candidatus Pacearchaeota archaeon]|nr:hypothetical protein [Candidatus Pacearchaeota archaeon]
MIGSIDHKADICLFLEPSEIVAMASATLEGVLIMAHNIKSQGTFSITVNNARQYENGGGIGIEDQGYHRNATDFRINVFVGDQFYRLLVSNGGIGTRTRLRDGSKIDISDISKLESTERMYLEDLIFYRDNKDRLH